MSFFRSRYWTSSKTLLLLIALFSFGVQSFGASDPNELVVHDLDALGKHAPRKVWEQREKQLNGFHVDFAPAASPTISEAIEAINEQLKLRKLGFTIHIHVAEDAEDFWRVVRKIRIFELDEFNNLRGAERTERLNKMSAYALLNAIGEETGMLSWAPVQFPDKMVISFTVASLPYTLEEHLGKRSDTGKAD